MHHWQHSDRVTLPRETKGRGVRRGVPAVTATIAARLAATYSACAAFAGPSRSPVSLRRATAVRVSSAASLQWTKFSAARFSRVADVDVMRGIISPAVQYPAEELKTDQQDEHPRPAIARARAGRAPAAAPRRDAAHQSPQPD
jgi:hypothetical protein